MVKLVALYSPPADKEAFDLAFFGTHVPLVKKIPGLQRVEINRITGAPRREPGFYLNAELYFDDKGTMEAGLASPENMEAGKNLMSFAKGLVSFMYAEELLV